MRSMVRAGAGLAIALVLAACTTAATSAPTSAPTQAAPTTAATTAATTAPTSAATVMPTAAGEAPCTDVTDSGEATTVDAAAAGFEWAPPTVNAKVGDVITWTNVDSAPHKVRLDDGSCQMDENMGGEQARSLQFSVAGEFPFHCSVHPAMKGTIIITE